MGSGYRVFTAGEVLTASNVQNYLQDQAVMVFGGTAARSSAIGTANFEEGMLTYLTDVDKLQVYTGAAFADVYPAAATNQGLTLINTTSFSAVSSHSLATNTFTSTYDAYRLVFTNLICSGNNQFRLRFRKAGTDNTSSIYYGAAGIMTWGGSLAAGGSGAAATSAFLFQLSTVFNTLSLDITQPLVRPQVTGLAMSAGPEDRGSFISAFINTSDTFDSATFLPSAGTITGTVSVYGYNK
jgi:hypothetical protein